jgi:tartrate-resistant acid phosphatase type 5
MRKISLLVVSVVISGFLYNSVFSQAPVLAEQGYKGGSIPNLQKKPNSLHFIVMGDWGRNGENYQKEVAASMGKAGHDLGVEFIIATGDNFYPRGVMSTRDYHWISSFESIYTAHSLYVRWHPVLGNHDYGANPDAQVEYSNLSSRWDMPARYYTKTYRVDTSSALFVFIDTDPLEKLLRGDIPDKSKYDSSYLTKELTWIDSVLASSKARWKIVVGHHPLYTGGWRKDTKETERLRKTLEPIFSKNKVDVYFCGHEHHQEIIVPPNSKTTYYISGAGSESRVVDGYPTITRFKSSDQGFMVCSLSSGSLYVQVVNHENKIIFKYEQIK